MRLFKSVVDVKFLEIFVFKSFAKMDTSHFCAVESDSTSVLLQKKLTVLFISYPPSDLVEGAPGAEHDKTYVG